MKPFQGDNLNLGIWKVTWGKICK